MDQQDNDPVATAQQHWFPAKPKDHPQPDDAAAIAERAREDVSRLTAEVNRLRRELAALTPPAKTGMEQVRTCCERMRQYLADPDNIVDYITECDQFVLPVRGSSRSGVAITCCPWCGSRLPPSGDDYVVQGPVGKQ